MIANRIRQTGVAVLLISFTPLLIAEADTTRSIESADASQAGVSFMRDSSTERQPALTTFPGYPTIARRDRIEGEATVCFDIDARGKVKRASVRDYSHKIFRKPALRAIKKSTFAPLRPDQVMARAKTCRTYRFRLDPILAKENG